MTDKLNKEQIKELLPHREPMLLIDELDIKVTFMVIGSWVEESNNK